MEQCIGIIGAMNIEVEALISQLEDARTESCGMDLFSLGRLWGQPAVLAVCGPGKVNAALCAQSLITRYQPRWVLNLGVAGSADDSVGIGDMVIANAAVQHDMDTSPIGDPVGYISKVGLVELPCDEALAQALARAAATVPGVRVHRGIIATGDQFICDAASRSRIRERFHALAVEMEGAAVAHACCMHGVPCGVLRSISDQADGHSSMDYPSFTRLAAAHSQQVVAQLLRDHAV